MPASKATVTKYISDVQSGKIVTSDAVKRACQRHLNDLATGSDRGLTFSESKASHILAFIEQFCHHSQGEWAGQLFTLEPWQAALLWIMYGWTWTATGYRRFRYAYVELAKGNGKSALASCLGLYELIGSGEPGAEVYSVATKKDQARIVFSEAERMVKQSPTLKARIKSFRDNLHIAGTASKFQPLSSDEDSLDGPRPQCIIVDELHAWGSGARRLWDVLANALGKRRSPLFFVITTAGSGRESLCWQQHEYSFKVLTGALEDDTWFCWICGLDPEDDPNDPALWIKANPNLGTSVRMDELSAVVHKAKGDPASLNGVLRLRLGVWTSSHTAWMPVDAWDVCTVKVDLESLKGQPCFGGLDLSTTTDISAFVLLFPPFKERTTWAVVPHLFLPEENIQQRVKRDRVPYDLWNKQGLFHLTPGNIIDYPILRAKIKELSDTYDIREVVFDPWNCTETATILAEQFGLQTVKMPPRDKNIAAAMKRLMELVLAKELSHNDNPVLRWMSGNVMARVDAEGHTFPDKAASTEKIDGIMALILALTRAMHVSIGPSAASQAPILFFTV